MPAPLLASAQSMLAAAPTYVDDPLAFVLAYHPSHVPPCSLAVPVVHLCVCVREQMKTLLREIVVQFATHKSQQHPITAVI